MKMTRTNRKCSTVESKLH